MDVVTKMRHVHRQFAASEGALLLTTNQMAATRSLGRLSIHVVVTAAMAPSASRCDGASATIARHHDEHSGQDQGTGQEQGRTRQINERTVRALCVPYSRVNRGISRLITVSRNRCSTVLICVCHVVPKLYTRFNSRHPLHSLSLFFHAAVLAEQYDDWG